MIPFTEQAKWYAQYHHRAATKYTHMVGIPLILFSLLLFFGLVHVTVPNTFDMRLSDFIILFLIIYYFRLQWLLTLVLAPILVLLLLLANWLTAAGPTPYLLWSMLIIFVIGVIVQLVGHLLEGKRPAIFDNVKFDLASPLFLTAEAFFMAGKMKGLQEKIYGSAGEQIHIGKE